MMMRMLANATFWMPEQGSTYAHETDWLFYFIYWTSVIFTALIFFTMVIFAYRYRHREGRPAPAQGAGHSTTLEITWTIIPTIIVLVIFYYGFTGYIRMQDAPPKAMEILVTGRSWAWSYTYDNGLVTDQLHVPAGVPVRLVMTSDDVIHSFFVPAFRMKKDVVPGRYNKLWFEVPKSEQWFGEGKTSHEFDVYCAEYCGKNHSEMLSKVIVHDSPTTFKSWMEEANDPTRNYAGPKQWGEVLYKSRGCNQCHTVDGSTLAGGGPSWKNLFGEQTTFTDGTTAVADEEYIRDSILYPAKHIVQGYTNIMPSFLGSLNERDVNSLVAYMKSISEKHDSENISWKDIGIEASSSEQPTQDPAGAAGEQPVVPTGEAPIVPGEGATE